MVTGNVLIPLIAMLDAATIFGTFQWVVNDRLITARVAAE